MNRRHLLLIVLTLHTCGVTAAEDDPEPDPDAAGQIQGIARNFDVISSRIEASRRVRRKAADAPALAAATQQALSERDLRMLAARGAPINVNVCSVVQGLRGAAQAPTFNNARVDINCVASNVVVRGQGGGKS